jgi:hypothetical protein
MVLQLVRRRSAGRDMTALRFPFRQLQPEVPTHIETSNGLCKVRGCERMSNVVRVSRRGWFLIHYCQDHENQAHEFFGTGLGEYSA